APLVRSNQFTPRSSARSPRFCGESPVPRPGALSPPQRLDQLALGHPAPTFDVPLLCDVVELFLRTILVGAVRVARALCGPVGRPPLLAPALVDGAGGDLLGTVFGRATLARALLDVLVLPLVLVAPLRHRDLPLGRGSCWRQPTIARSGRVVPIL